MAISPEVLRYRLSVGLVFLAIGVIFAAAVAVEIVSADRRDEGTLTIRPPERPRGPTEEEIRAGLDSPDPQERIRSMATLLSRNDTEAKGRVVGALRDPHPAVRQYAIGQVSAMGPGYLPHVASLLGDVDEGVRSAAVSALSTSPAVAAPYIAPYVGSADSAVARSAWRLVEPAWRADPAQTRAAVIAGLQSRDDDVRQKAAAFARALPPDDRSFFRSYLDRLPPETAPAPAGPAPVSASSAAPPGA